MGRSDIAEVGRRFSSEYQPGNRGRPKGRLNKRTIVRLWFEQQDPPPPEKIVTEFLDALFGKRQSRRIRRRMDPKAVKRFFPKDASLFILSKKDATILRRSQVEQKEQ